MEQHWTEKLFVEKPSLFTDSLENLLEQATGEVVGLVNVFSEFQVSKNSLVLDLCCGIGRHSVALAEKGFKVVGVDISPEFIARAREIAVERKVNRNVEFKVGDMRKISEVLKECQEKFNAVINLFTSIGYYDREMDRNILGQLRELTTSRGILVIDIANRDWLVRHFQARDAQQISDVLFRVVERKLNLESSRMENVWKYYRKHKHDLEYLETVEVNHRVYSLHELKKLVEESGWIYQTCYGGFNSDPFTMDSRRIVLVAKKN